MDEDEYYLEVKQAPPGGGEMEFHHPLLNMPSPTPLQQAQALAPAYHDAGASSVVLVRRRPTYHRTTIDP